MSSSAATPNSNSYSISSTPANTAHRKKPQTKTTSKKVTLMRKDGTRLFTPAMQDKQARNKDNYSSDSSSDEAGPAWASVNGRNAQKDTWEQTQKRREAAVILDNPELLMMHAQARFDSIPGTRYYFTKLLCGFLSDSEPYSPFSLSTNDQTSEHRSRHSRSRNQDSIQRQYLREANAEDGDGDGDGSEDGDGDGDGDDSEDGGDEEMGEEL